MHLTRVFESIEAKYWVSWLSFKRLTSVNTSYQNCLEFVILCSNGWLKIEVTARPKSVFRRFRAVLLIWMCVCRQPRSTPRLMKQRRWCAMRSAIWPTLCRKPLARLAWWLVWSTTSVRLCQRCVSVLIPSLALPLRFPHLLHTVLCRGNWYVRLFRCADPCQWLCWERLGRRAVRELPRADDQGNERTRQEIARHGKNDGHTSAACAQGFPVVTAFWHRGPGCSKPV